MTFEQHRPHLDTLRERFPRSLQFQLASYRAGAGAFGDRTVIWRTDRTAKRIYAQVPVDDEVRCPILGLATRRNHSIGEMVEPALIKFD